MVREFPLDLGVVVAWVVVAWLVIFGVVAVPPPLRVAAALPIVVFVPGYAVVAAMFPRAASLYAPGDAENVDVTERILLSVVTSVVLSILVGVTLEYTVFSIDLRPISASLGLVTLVATGVSTYRRSLHPPERQFGVRARDDPTETALPALPDVLTPVNVIVLVAVLLTVGSVAYVSAVPQGGERFTELGLLTRADDGSLVADSYPQELTPSDRETLVVSIQNRERRTVTYTLLVQLQRVGTRGTIFERAELDRFERTVPPGETVRITHTISSSPRMGADVRLSYLLYVGEPPPAPNPTNAYREVHLWVDTPPRNS